MNDFNPEWLIVHCTATPPSMTSVDAYWVDRVHRRKGWLGCGYQEIITRPHEGQPAQRQNYAGGFPTRSIDRAGAHVGGCGAGWNSKTIGVSLAGGIDEDGKPSDNFHPDQIELLLEAIREYQEMFNIPDERVIGHRDLIRMTNSSPKACPCMSVQALMTQGKVRHGGSYNHKRKLERTSPLGIPEFHKVRRGESLWGISAAYGVPIAEISELNNITDNDLIKAGQKLRLRNSTN